MEATNEYLENGYFIHNETQISVEINGEIKLFEADNTTEFAKKIIIIKPT